MARGLIPVALLASLLSPALVAASYGADRGNFSCIPTASLDATTGDDEFVRLNNFILHEKIGRDSYAAGMNVTFAARNITDADVFLTADFILFDADDQPLAAINAGPPKLRVAAHGAAIATGVTTVATGTLAKTQTVCLRWFADRYDCYVLQSLVGSVEIEESS